jgi:hypothetical protein
VRTKTAGQRQKQAPCKVLRQRPALLWCVILTHRLAWGTSRACERSNDTGYMRRPVWGAMYTWRAILGMGHGLRPPPPRVVLSLRTLRRAHV